MSQYNHKYPYKREARRSKVVGKDVMAKQELGVMPEVGYEAKNTGSL